MLNLLENRLTEVFTGSIFAQGHAVPAFEHSASGQLWLETFPCLSYDLGFPQFDLNRAISNDNSNIRIPSSQAETIVMPDGSMAVGPPAPSGDPSEMTVTSLSYE